MIHSTQPRSVTETTTSSADDSSSSYRRRPRHSSRGVGHIATMRGGWLLSVVLGTILLINTGHAAPVGETVESVEKDIVEPNPPTVENKEAVINDNVVTPAVNTRTEAPVKPPIEPVSVAKAASSHIPTATELADDSIPIVNDVAAVTEVVADAIAKHEPEKNFKSASVIVGEEEAEDAPILTMGAGNNGNVQTVEKPVVISEELKKILVESRKVPANFNFDLLTKDHINFYIEKDGDHHIHVRLPADQLAEYVETTTLTVKTSLPPTDKPKKVSPVAESTTTEVKVTTTTTNGNDEVKVVIDEQPETISPLTTVKVITNAHPSTNPSTNEVQVEETEPVDENSWPKHSQGGLRIGRTPKPPKLTRKKLYRDEQEIKEMDTKASGFPFFLGRGDELMTPIEDQLEEASKVIPSKSSRKLVPKVKERTYAARFVSTTPAPAVVTMKTVYNAKPAGFPHHTKDMIVKTEIKKPIEKFAPEEAKKKVEKPKISAIPTNWPYKTDKQIVAVLTNKVNPSRARHNQRKTKVHAPAKNWPYPVDTRTKEAAEIYLAGAHNYPYVPLIKKKVSAMSQLHSKPLNWPFRQPVAEEKKKNVIAKKLQQARKIMNWPFNRANLYQSPEEQAAIHKMIVQTQAGHWPFVGSVSYKRTNPRPATHNKIGTHAAKWPFIPTTHKKLMIMGGKQVPDGEFPINAKADNWPFEHPIVKTISEKHVKKVASAPTKKAPVVALAGGFPYIADDMRLNRQYLERVTGEPVVAEAELVKKITYSNTKAQGFPMVMQYATEKQGSAKD